MAEDKIIKKCAVCGFENEVDYMEPVEELGLRDLDTRPASPKRQEIRFGVHRCEKCGYASRDISLPIDFNPQILKSEKYLEVLHSNYSYLTKTYMLASMIKESTKNYKEAAELMLNAVWMRDDKGLDSEDLRFEAARLYKECPLTDKVKRILVDLYRRAEDFEEAENLCNEYRDTVTDIVDKQVLEFEAKLIEDYDSDCHSLEEMDSNSWLDYLDVRADPISEIERKLYDENSNENLFLIYNGKVTKFDQVALIQLEIENENRLFTILSNEEVLGEGGAIVYELIGDSPLERLAFVDDDAVCDMVIQEYYRLLE